eukprot:Em0001g404a
MGFPECDSQDNSSSPHPQTRTEQLVDHVLTSCQSTSHGAEGWVWFLDVGCGSGAISIALLAERPELRGVAIDISTEAVDLTKENAIMNNVQGRLDVMQASIGNCSNLTFGGRLFDILVCNPPYIPSHVLQGLDPEVLWFEDHRALDGGHDGLRVTVQVLEAAQSIVKKGGHIWLELTADLDLRQLMELNSHWRLSLHQSYSDFAHKSLQALIYRPLGARLTSAVTNFSDLKRKWVKALQAEGIPEPELAVKSIVDHLTRNQLVDHVLTSCQSTSHGAEGWVWFLDVGCGSGAISIALLAERPELRGVAIDISTEAVDLTKENAIKNNVQGRLDVMQASIGNCSNLTFGGRLFDILVCNPPYIPSHVLQGLDPEVLWFEDHRALGGGHDGLRVTVQVLEAAQSIVKKGG